MTEVVWVPGFALPMDAITLLIPIRNPEKGRGYCTASLDLFLLDDPDFPVGSYVREKLKDAERIAARDASG